MVGMPHTEPLRDEIARLRAENRKLKSMMKTSPEAAKRLLDAITSGDISPFGMDADDLMGETDCPEGCFVEPDGYCPHGYQSAGLSAGVI